MRSDDRIFRILCAKYYEDRFKLLTVTEENLDDVFETMVHHFANGLPANA